MCYPKTKGREDLDVDYKDKRALKWCEDVSVLTDQPWRYIKVPEKDFKKLKPETFSELVGTLAVGGPMFVME